MGDHPSSPRQRMAALGVGSHGDKRVPARGSVLAAMWSAAMPDEYQSGRTMESESFFQTQTNYPKEGNFERKSQDTQQKPKEKAKSKPNVLQSMVSGTNFESGEQESLFERGPNPWLWAEARFNWGGKPPPGHEKIGPHGKGKGRTSHDSDAENGAGSKSKTVKARKISKREIEGWKNSGWILKAKDKLKRKMFSSSTHATKNAKRKKLKEVMETCGVTKFQESGITCDGLLSIAAVLGEMGLKSADQYLGEVKLMQLELGISWSDVLDRQMYMLKRALKRDIGPEHRAKEVKILEITPETWEKRIDEPGVQCRVAWSFVWATLWMLRSIEAANLRTSDLMFNAEKRIVSLYIRKSKTDQKASGVRRSMQCCGNDLCDQFCPWNLGLRIMADHVEPPVNTPLFPDFEGSHVPKVNMVKAWMEEVDTELTGHSARRTGAMWYARRFMPIQEIAMLGRWKSSAVFRYVEEALQDIPLNNSVRGTDPQDNGGLPDGIRGFKRRVETTQELHQLKVPGDKASEKTSRVPKVQKISPQVPEQIWVISTARKGQLGHRVRQASWDMPLHRWATWCGWHFADRNVKVSMVTKLQQGMKRCKKCENHSKARDVVKEGVSLAQLLHLGDSRHKIFSTGRDDCLTGQIQPSSQKEVLQLLEGGRVERSK